MESQSTKGNHNVIDKSVVCCLSVRNCAKYLPKFFDNLTKLSKCFKKFEVVFVYDNCNDNSEQLLNEYKSKSNHNVRIIDNINNTHPYRTVRIASSRNVCLDVVYNEIKDVDFHMVIDADDVNYCDWNIDLILYYLEKDNWDALSFNRKSYYDIWALLLPEYMCHCWGFDIYSPNVITYLASKIVNNLDNLKDKDDLFECLSAFNGFALYRTPNFVGIKYNGYCTDFNNLLNKEDVTKSILRLRSELNINDLFIPSNHTECCEHLYYHLTAIRDNKVRVRVSKYMIVEDSQLDEPAKTILAI
jgi:glycosyltransferase involved in cell wall biosynthesis